MTSKAVVAIGAGPSNLSLAALAAPLPQVDVTVFERQQQPDWHSGLLVEGARMQTSALKDLVTLVDPTSEFSFLAYLKAKRRLYRAVVRGLERISRVEFEDYLRWAAARLSDVRCGEAVESVALDGEAFVVTTSAGRVRAETIVLGVGRSPVIPDFAVGRLDADVFHASRLLSDLRDFTGKRVAVVGGGQSGAEVVRELLRGTCGTPASLDWVSRRANLFALEDSPFVNEWFFPQHSTWHNDSSPDVRRRMLEVQILASDGICMEMLKDLYDRLYAIDIGQDPARLEYRIHLNATVEAMWPQARGELLVLRDALSGAGTRLETDVVIFCTGYGWALPSFLHQLRPRLSFCDARRGGLELELGRDFSVEWDGPPGCRIYVQNGALTQHGIADPNLSLISWRSAKILNSILGMEAYDCGYESGALDPGFAPAPPDPQQSIAASVQHDHEEAER